VKKHNGKQLTDVTGPLSPKEYTPEEIAGVERIASETGKMPNRKWRRFYERWKARQVKP
jgi:hypothetical protein